MKPPHLGEVPYFSIPPFVNLSQLEEKLNAVRLNSNDLVIRAMDLAQIVHGNIIRRSKKPELEEHIYSVAYSVLEYQLYQKKMGGSKFKVIAPEGVVLALLHDVLDVRIIIKGKFRKIFGDTMFDSIYPLIDMAYPLGLPHREKTEMKFKRLETCPWPTQITGLADRLNNSLCYYTPSYLDEKRQPGPIMQSRLLAVKDIVMPFAKSVSPDFFYPMFEELMAHYRKKYPNLFTAK